jgi:2-methylcitrate dehydratase PrpD
MHPGWAAQSGYRAVRLAMAGFKGPRTVFEGEHGLFHGFANTMDGDFAAMMADFGSRWVWPTIAFKPYACGTMCHPYIDCAREFGRRGIDPESIASIECEVGEGTVHRLWEPLAQKRMPPNGYAAKFSVPYALAVAILRDDAGLREYDDAMVKDEAILRLASKVSYRIDPANPYPRQFTGHVRVQLRDGTVYEHRQGYFKGGADHPLSDDDLARKFMANCEYGGLSTAAAQGLRERVATLFEQPHVDFTSFAG